MESRSFVLALDGLDAGLLVDAQYHRARRRFAIQLADGIDLLAKLRIGAVQRLPHAVRASVKPTPTITFMKSY